jgi:hypothetical protein
MTYSNADSNERVLTFYDSRLSSKQGGAVPPDISQSYIEGQRWKTQEELWEIHDNCMQENWDGYEATAVDEATFKTAGEFLAVLPDSMMEPEVTADPDGEISFEWFMAHNMVFSISVNAFGRLAYAGILGARKVHGIEQFRGVISPIILEFLSGYFGKYSSTLLAS